MPDNRAESKAQPLDPEFIAQVHALHRENIGLQRIAKQLGQSYRQVLRAYHASPRNGDHPESVTLPAVPEAVVPSAAPAHPSALERISALQRIEPATIRDHEARLMVLEAYIATLQHQLQLPSAPQRINASAHPEMPAHPIAPERTEPPVWVNRGTHIAQDMVEAIARYAARYRLERREVIDLALRTFFALEGRGNA